MIFHQISNRSKDKHLKVSAVAGSQLCCLLDLLNIYRPHELSRSTYEVGSEEVDWGSVTPGEVHRLHQARFSGYTRRGSAATPGEVRRLHQARFSGYTRRGSSIRPPPAPPIGRWVSVEVDWVSLFRFYLLLTNGGYK